MNGSTKRGYSPEDERNFKGDSLKTIRRAAEELYYLLNRGYPIKVANTFVGNHYLLTQRQRTALIRMVASEAEIAVRKAKQPPLEAMAHKTVNIDGFNEIITLEVAQAGSPVFRCMDGTYRDLAGLHGSYRLIDQTDVAIRLVFSELRKRFVPRAVFWLDAPVSNSGRLKTRIAEIAEEEQFEVGIEIVNHVDKVLYELPNVISSDSILLNHCPSWLNLNEALIPHISDVWILDLEAE